MGSDGKWCFITILVLLVFRPDNTPSVCFPSRLLYAWSDHIRHSPGGFSGVWIRAACKTLLRCFSFPKQNQCQQCKISFNASHHRVTLMVHGSGCADWLCSLMIYCFFYCVYGVQYNLSSCLFVFKKSYFSLISPLL